MPHRPRHASQSRHAHHAAAYSKENGDFVLQAAQSANITDPKELANFMGQMQVESHGFTKMHENLNYSGERLLKVFPGRNGMDTIEKANAVAAGGPEKIAETIYGGDWGKRRGGPGNTEASDGWKFHGRGFVQLTGRYNYEHYGKALGLDLVNHPDLAAEPANAAKIATQYWKERVVALGHQHDVTHATKDVNGRYTALAERKAAVAQWETKLAHGYKPGDPEPGQSLQDSPLYKQAKSALQEIDVQFGRKSDQLTDNAAAAITVAALRGGLTRIDHITLGGNDNSTIFAIQGKPGAALSKFVDVPTVESMHTPVAQSSQAFTVVQQVQQQAPQQNSQQAAQQTAPAMAR
ncbi:XVIPCD domain-containing protein [Variovorax sp. DXTD-1]|uniref:XVIPCD domain-containing protein n=1 Tax=Variovorax sp. DXTD-1 TaxID=2495592 RepID=UPI00163C1CAB|nr:XVIPCD domain-containing protein [Variovorax sp. DXTD-1]